MGVRYYVRAASGLNVEITDRIRDETLRVTSSAEQGAVAASEIVIEDPLGDIIIGGHRVIRAMESAAPVNDQIIWMGYTAERRIKRGNMPTAGGARLWEVSLVDINTILSRRLMEGADANRPAETDVARVQWVEATNEGSLIDDTTYLSTANPVAMDAVDYRGQYLMSVLDDCSQASGKNYFLTPIQYSTSPFGVRYGLWYDSPNSTAFSSAIRISNVLADVDSSVTFAASTDSELVRDPSRVFSGIEVPYDGGRVFRERPDTESAFALGGRDTPAPSVNVKTSAKAAARAVRFLDDMATEEDTITTHITVPSAQVNAIRAGHRVACKFNHLPGYEAFTWLRVLDRTVDQSSLDTFQVALTLSGTPGPLVQTKFTVYSGGFSFDTAPQVGNLVLIWIATRNGDGTSSSLPTAQVSASDATNLPPGFTNIATVGHSAAVRGGRMAYRVVQAGDGNAYYKWLGTAMSFGMEWAASYVGFNSKSNGASSTNIDAGGLVTPTAGQRVILVGGASIGASDTDYLSGNAGDAGAMRPGSNVLELIDRKPDEFSPAIWVGYREVASASGSYTISGTYGWAQTFSGVTVILAPLTS